MLACLEPSDRLAPADLMRKHLEQARRRKLAAAFFEAVELPVRAFVLAALDKH